MNVMFYEKLELQTSRTPQEIRKRLEEGIGKPRGGGFAALRIPEKLFEGTFENNRFRFWRAIRHNNGFMPIITGSIEPGMLKVELKLHPFIQVFLPLWLGGLLFIGWVVPKPTGGAQSWCTMTAYVPWGVIVFVLFLGIFFFNFYADKAREFLKLVAG